MLRAAAEAGADVAVLCDTNGGRLPDEVADVVHAVRAATGARLGIHCHNDAGCAVANSLAAVDAGATHVQGTLNGYGERTGNADILTVVANLELKRSRRVLPTGRLQEATRMAHAVVRARERAAVQPPALRRRVRVRAQGRPARQRDPGRPDALPARGAGARSATTCGCWSRTWPAARSIELKGRELGYDLSGNDDAARPGSPPKVKEMEARGYTFEAADASFELLLRAEVEGAPAGLLRGRVVAGHRRRARRRGRHVGTAAEATVKLRAGGERLRRGRARATARSTRSTTRCAARSGRPTRSSAKLELIDYRVRIVDAAHGTDAVTRVLVETSDGETSWETVGVHANIIEASWEALLDAVTYGLLRHRGDDRPDRV